MVYTIIWRNTVSKEYRQEKQDLPLSLLHATEALTKQCKSKEQLVGIIPGDNPIHLAPKQSNPIQIDIRESMAFIFSEDTNILVIQKDSNVDIWIEDFEKNKKYIFTIGKDEILEFKNRKTK